MIERANCVIALRSEGVSLVLDVSAGQLPAIVHWGADLGMLDPADAEALIISNIDPGGPNVVDEPVRLALLARTLDGLGRSPGPERIASRPGLVAQVHRNGGPARRGARRRDRWFTDLDQFGRSSVEVDAVDEVAQLWLPSPSS